MSRKNESVDRRWRGVRVASLHTVLLRATDPEEDRDALAAEAWAVLKAGKVWREYEAVFGSCDDPQIHGYRKVNSKAWFLLGDDGVVEGPFPTRRLVLSKLRVKSCTKGPPGVYMTPGYTLFTRDAAESVGLNRRDLA